MTENFLLQNGKIMMENLVLQNNINTTLYKKLKDNIKEDEMGRTCSMNGEAIEAYSIFHRKSEGRRL
jgi:hypothetical protein